MPPFDGEAATPRASIANALVVRSINKLARTVDFVASTDAIDSYGDRVVQNWRLERYKANPVLLFAHNTRELPIGRCTRIEVVGGQLECTAEFAPEALNEKAEEVFQMIVAGYLKAVSVGFIPHTFGWMKENDREVFILDDNELYEVSVVPVPANPEALAKAKSLAREQGIAATREAKQPGPPGSESNTATGRKDFDMNEKELREALDKKDAELATAKKDAEAATLRVKALETQNETLVKERDAAVVEVKALRASVVEKDVEALVGVKITPAEKGMFVELATSNPDLFKKMVEQRSPLAIATPATASKLPADPLPETKSIASGDPADVSDLTDELHK